MTSVSVLNNLKTMVTGRQQQLRSRLFMVTITRRRMSWISVTGLWRTFFKLSDGIIAFLSIRELIMTDQPSVQSKGRYTSNNYMYDVDLFHFFYCKKS